MEIYLESLGCECSNRFESSLFPSNRRDTQKWPTTVRTWPERIQSRTSLTYLSKTENLQVRTLFYTGAYPQCVNAALGNPQARTDKGKIERQVFQYRAQLAMGRFKLVISEVEGSTAPEHQAVYAFALYLTAKTDADLEEAVERVRVMASENAGNAIVAVLAATAFFKESMYDEALKALSGHPRNMEWWGIFSLCFLDLLEPWTEELTR